MFPQVPAYFGLSVFKLGVHDQFKDELDWAVQYFQDISLKNKYGYHCWNSIGFPLQMRSGYSEVDVPDVVGGSLIGRYLLQYYLYHPREEVKEVILSQYYFFLNELYVDLGEQGFIRYRPNQPKHKITYNASLLACKFLMEVDKHFDTDSSVILKKCFELVINRQKGAGQWYYTINLNTMSEKKQVDFHQGFILDAILDYIESSKNDGKFLTAYKKGLEFYYNNQFMKSGQGIYRYPKKWPVNIHNQSQGVTTFSRAGQFDPKFMEFAQTIADWTITHMQDKRHGHFYYLKYPFFINKVPYIRWSDANMLLALTNLINASKQLKN
ncbi:MAG: hypothetical protein WD267_03960 [Balneolales bacterium]